MWMMCNLGRADRSGGGVMSQKPKKDKDAAKESIKPPEYLKFEEILKIYQGAAHA
jgi:hypothetical protein